MEDTMSYYMGVDGGGTKTEYALFNDEKKMIATIKTAGSNHENYERSFDEASGIIWDGLNKLANKAGVSLKEVSFTLMGLAGIDHPFQYDIMCSKLKAFGLDNFEIFNDGFIVVKAGSETGAAIGYNCGTGTCCNAIDSTGKMLQLAGLSDLSGDMGNGHWIAIRAFRLIYDEVYLGLRNTLLTKMFFDEFHLSNREQFLDSVSELEGKNAEKYIMRLIDFFFAAAYQGDEPVLDAINEMADRGASLIAAHANQLYFIGEYIEVILSGSIHTKLPSDIYLDIMKEKLGNKNDRQFRFIKLKEPPVVGCINWIFQNYR
jgi:N-acetylglucosamine kinase-like BadF-type ATPase